MKLEQISREKAKELFESGTVIYIQDTDLMYPVEDYNAFGISATHKSASLNLYLGEMTPLEYGFDSILAWLKRMGCVVVRFFTFNSKEHILIDYAKEVESVDTVYNKSLNAIL